MYFKNLINICFLRLFKDTNYFNFQIYTFRNGHMLTHRNKKPYECKAEGCGKSYCDARSLRRHTENHHSSSTVNATTMSPAQGAASGDAASPHGSSCIQYAPPPTSTSSSSSSSGKSQLQQLLATEPAKVISDVQI